ncbi:hypothetical protein J2W91_003529 [Paenibacillus amylolyticus]|uniref:Uncharacterized protein n=1 Tax=Paenibacillus amylolyticus TaxID=1451 RepID=A0AAP5LQ23_PAEAM|nr:hypothetical protein [Paenibacillus amylolyticus]MDR6725043.1 hypothetical protein [Paenibacillus amylolyticus]
MRKEGKDLSTSLGRKVGVSAKIAIRRGKVKSEFVKGHYRGAAATVLSRGDVVRISDRSHIGRMEKALGLDKVKPINITQSDAEQMQDDLDYFKGWYEDELKELFDKG